MVIYFYVAHRQPTTLNKTKLTTSLMVQVFGRSPDTPQVLVDLQRYIDTGSSQPEKLLNQALLEGIRDFDNVYTVLDGLDECPNAEDAGHTSVRDERKEMLRLVSFLLNSELENIHLTVFSRPEPDISSHFEELKGPRCTTSYTIDLSAWENSHHVDINIKTYIESQFKELKSRNVELSDKELIKKTLAEKADGM